MVMTHRVFITSFLVLIVGITLSLSPSTLLAKKKMPTPDDFRITLHSSPRMPMSPDPAPTLVIEPNGHCKYYERSRGEENVLKREFDLDAEAMKKIYDTIKKEKFFDLKQEYRDPEVMDGDFAEMEITADGKKHRVTTINIKVDAFDNIVGTINAQTPAGASIIYNALHVKEYKRIER